MNRSSVAWAMGLAFFVAGTAHAALQPVADTPENDLLDSATGLAWIKVANSQDGAALGYRLATEAEAAGLDYAGQTYGAGIYALGVDRTGAWMIGDTTAVKYAVSYGRVQGANGQILLAGYSQDGPYSTLSASKTPSYFNNHLFVGEQSLFADVVDPGPLGYMLPQSRVLDGTGLACRAGGCFPGNTLWTGALDGAHGYFMVRSAVPEAANWATMGLGLLCLGVTVRSRRRVG
ncbi:MAG: hypothetical protein RI907_1981 [Pseudomonadota bacterium]|jgi:hypothetical protein